MERKESRDFDVFLECFWVFGRDKKEKKKRRKKLGRRENFIKMCVLPVCGVVKAIYNLGHVFQGGSPSRAVGLERPQNEWILTPLERS